MIFHALNRGNAWDRIFDDDVQASVIRGHPFGSESWQETTAKHLGLESPFRTRGLP